MKRHSQPNFDRIATPYRWLEYVTLGRALERCRLHFLPQLSGCRSALILGDGDGRFAAQLLARNREITVTAVDTSAAMLRLLEARCEAYRDRLTTRHANALHFVPETTYDLICTHFFLDCLETSQIESLAARLAAPGTTWVVSEFRIPPTGILRWPAWAFVRSLSLAFRMLTGLRTTQLPDHAGALSRAGFVRTAQHLSFGDILTTEFWVVGQSEVNDY